MRRRVMFILPLLALGMQPIPKPAELDAWMKAGDHRAVPIILARLREAAARSHDNDTDRYYMVGMIQHAAKYQLDEAGPLMVRLYHRGGADDSYELGVLAYSAAQYQSDAATGLLRASLTDGRLRDEKDADLRIMLLSALAERGDDRAADAIADWAIDVLAQSACDNVMSQSLSATIPMTRSKRLLERVNAFPMPPAPTTNPSDEDAQITRHRRFLRRLRDDLALANDSPEKMIEFVASAAPDQVSRIDTALDCLGKFGEPAQVPTIESAPLGKDNRLAGNDRLETSRRTAIAAIKRRHWAQYAELAATQPSDR